MTGTDTGTSTPGRRRELVRAPAEVLSLPATAWWLVAALVALGVVTLLLTVGWQPLHRVDHTVADWGYRLTYQHAFRSTLWNDVAQDGQPFVLRIVLVLIGLYQLWRGRRALGIWLIAVPIVENVVAPASKYLLNRPRPHWLHPIAVEHSTSFPSGHAAGSGMFALAVALVAATTLRSAAARWAVTAAGVVIGLVICVDRIFLGVHYFSDVVGGILLGVAVTLAGWLVMLAVLRRRTRQD